MYVINSVPLSSPLSTSWVMNALLMWAEDMLWPCFKNLVDFPTRPILCSTMYIRTDPSVILVKGLLALMALTTAGTLKATASPHVQLFG